MAGFLAVACRVCQAPTDRVVPCMALWVSCRTVSLARSITRTSITGIRLRGISRSCPAGSILVVGVSRSSGRTVRSLEWILINGWGIPRQRKHARDEKTGTVGRTRVDADAWAAKGAP